MDLLQEQDTTKSLRVDVRVPSFQKKKKKKPTTAANKISISNLSNLPALAWLKIKAGLVADMCMVSFGAGLIAVLLQPHHVCPRTGHISCSVKGSTALFPGMQRE